MPHVLRTAQAEQDLLEIWGDVAQRSPRKADRLTFLAADIGQGIANLWFGMRGERLMIRYHDALRERESEPIEGVGPGTPAP